MTTKKTTKTTTAKTAPTAEDLAQQAKKKADEEQFAARVSTDGTANVVVVARYLPNLNGGASSQALSAVLQEQVKAIAGGDLTQLETMLLAQATALQAMFVDLAYRAKAQDSREWLQLHSTLALKCAAGSRQAIVALAELRAPKSVLFAKQANFAQQQQVNNGMAAPVSAAVRAVRAGAQAHAEENAGQQNGLLEASHGIELDTRAQAQTGRENPQLEAVAAGHRATHG